MKWIEFTKALVRVVNLWSRELEVEAFFLIIICKSKDASWKKCGFKKLSLCSTKREKLSSEKGLELHGEAGFRTWCLSTSFHFLFAVCHSGTEYHSNVILGTLESSIPPVGYPKAVLLKAKA